MKFVVLPRFWGPGQRSQRPQPPQGAQRAQRDRRLQWRVGRWAAVLGLALGLMLGAGAHAADTSPAEQLQRWSAQAQAPGQAQRGQVFFQAQHGGRWSCASCHHAPPTTAGQHASTGKSIAPLAPGFNPKAFTDAAKADKWFRRNCNDVLRRECTAAEKADVLAYLLSLKP